MDGQEQNPQNDFTAPVEATPFAPDTSVPIANAPEAPVSEANFAPETPETPAISEAPAAEPSFAPAEPIVTPNATPAPNFSETPTFAPAPIISTPPAVQHVSEDIVLDGGASAAQNAKTRKLIKFGILGVVGAAVLIVATMFILSIVFRPSKADVVKSFSVYKDYIVYGPDNLGNDDDWFLFQLTGSKYSEADKKGYAENINVLFADFQKTLVASGMSLSSDLQNLITNESDMLRFAITLANFDAVTQPLIDSYVADGMEAAKGKIAQVVPPESNSSFRNNFRKSLIEYIESSLDMYAFYNKNYCIDNDTVSSECVASLDEDAQYLELLAQNKERARMVQGYLSRLEAELKATTIAIQEKFNE